MSAPLHDDTHLRIRSFLLIFLFILAALGLVADAGGVAALALLLAMLIVVDISLDVHQQQAGRPGKAR